MATLDEDLVQALVDDGERLVNNLNMLSNIVDTPKLRVGIRGFEKTALKLLDDIKYYRLTGLIPRPGPKLPKHKVINGPFERIDTLFLGDNEG